jgi:spore coat protein U-like protein
MKKTLLAMMFASCALPAFAANVNVQVKGKVLPTCSFEAPTDVLLTIPDMTPGKLDDKTAAGKVNFWCSKGTTFAVSLDNGLNGDKGQRNIKHNSGEDKIAYDLKALPESGAGMGALSMINIDLTATVEAAAYQSASEGDYADTVVLTVAP